MSRAVILLTLIACTPRTISTRGTAFPLYIEASADRANPHRITFDPQGLGEAKGHAPRAGDWWYVVVVARPPYAAGSYTFATSYDGAPGQLAFTLVDERGDHPATISDIDPNKSRLELPTTSTPPATFLLRITTTAPVKFRVFAVRK